MAHKMRLAGLSTTQLSGESLGREEVSFALLAWDVLQPDLLPLLPPPPTGKGKWGRGFCWGLARAGWNNRTGHRHTGVKAWTQVP